MGIFQIVRRRLLEMQKTNPNIKIPSWLESYCTPYERKRRAMLGPRNHRWKGGRIKKETGYIQVKNWDHPFCNKRGYVLEHRLVWEQHNNACLLPWADVHHKSGVKDQNNPQNLEAMMRRAHTRLECLKLQPWRYKKQNQKPMTPRNDDDTSDDSDTYLY